MKNTFGIKLFHSSFLNNDSCTFHTFYSFLRPFTYLHDFQLFHFLKKKLTQFIASYFHFCYCLTASYSNVWANKSYNTDTILFSPCFQLFNIYLHLKPFIYFPILNFLVSSVAQLVVVAREATFS